jgi:hypothetical protein
MSASVAAIVKQSVGGGCMDNSYSDFITQLRVTTGNPNEQVCLLMTGIV